MIVLTLRSDDTELYVSRTVFSREMLTTSSGVTWRQPPSLSTVASTSTSYTVCPALDSRRSRDSLRCAAADTTASNSELSVSEVEVTGGPGPELESQAT